jgi:hypothetical protein
MLEPDLPKCMSTHLLRELIKTETSQLVHTTCNCKKLHQVQRQTIYIEKPKDFESKKTNQKAQPKSEKVILD